jgi:methionyl-tRNA synthetase
MVLTHKFFDGKVPEFHHSTEEDKKLFAVLEEKKNLIENLLESFRFREAQAELMNIVRAGNKYLSDTEPWKLFKTDPDRVSSILHLCLQFCANTGVLSEPFLPFTAERIKNLLNRKQSLGWDDIGSQEILKTGEPIGQPQHLFEPVPDEAMDRQMEKLKLSKTMNQDSKTETAAGSATGLRTPKPEISYEEFDKIDMRVGTILEAEKVPKADKLLKLLIDTGIDKRTVVSGIAEFYKPEEIIGRQVSILVNLAPRKLRGIESQGMILMAENPEGKLVFVSPPDKFDEGSIIK